MTDETEVASPVRKTYRVLNFIDPVKLKEDHNYTQATIQDAMMGQAAIFAHYGDLAAKASRQVDDFKLLAEITEAKVYRICRDELAAKGEKVTEAALEKMVAVTPAMIQIKKALNEAKQIEASAKTTCESFRHRKDMLVQQGAQNREEYKGEVFIAARQATEDSLTSQKQRFLARTTPTP